MVFARCIVAGPNLGRGFGRPQPPGSTKVTTAICLTLLSLLSAVVGCQTYRSDPVVAWDLAQAAQIDPALTWRLRLTQAQCVPHELTKTLCEEYDVLHVTSVKQWRKLRRCVGVPDDSPGRDLDFSRGSIVGIIARIGEPATERWPIELEGVRLVDGNGWVNLRFAPGLYYPVRGAPFLYAVYVPGLHVPRIIQIDRLKFVIMHTDTTEHSPNSTLPLPGRDSRALKPGNSPC